MVVGRKKVRIVWILRPQPSLAEDDCKIGTGIPVYVGMPRAWISIVLLLSPLSHPEQSSDPSSRAIAIRPADPPSQELRDEMIPWLKFYVDEMAPLRRQWSRLVDTVHNGRISELPVLCPVFRHRLAELDRRGLLEVADPVVRTWLGRGLVLLDEAAGQCRRSRFFDLGFRLYKARHVIKAVDRRLEKYR